ncbi:hypothetical protein D918_04236 [Trichuris suis]|nr:hypothetical protein D918_04236 [Trichuris suis]
MESVCRTKRLFIIYEVTYGFFWLCLAADNSSWNASLSTDAKQYVFPRLNVNPIELSYLVFRLIFTVCDQLRCGHCRLLMMLINEVLIIIRND